MDSQHDNIEFEIEKPIATPDGYSLSLLDFNVTVRHDGNTSFDFYKKKAKKPLFVHHKSWLPAASKREFIINERNRISERCSDSDTKVQREKEFDSILRLNGYPPHIINQTKRDAAQRNARERSSEENSEDWAYFSIPYISDTLNNKLRKIFKNAGLKVRISHKSSTVRNALNPASVPTTCKLSNCPIDKPSKCFQRCVVYEITCGKCRSTYIGSTIRYLHERTKEHVNNSKSSVSHHLGICTSNRNNIEVRIITKDRDPVNLRLLEALYIKARKPSINSREECKELNDLLF